MKYSSVHSGKYVRWIDLSHIYQVWKHTLHKRNKNKTNYRLKWYSCHLSGVMVQLRNDWQVIHLSLFAVCSRQTKAYLNTETQRKYQPVNNSSVYKGWDYCWWKKVKPKYNKYCLRYVQEHQIIARKKIDNNHTSDVLS